MKILLPGGCGQVGTVLARHFVQSGHEVVALSRSPQAARGYPARVVGWDGATLGDWTKELADAEVVINLAGRSVNCRYHAQNRAAILNSRLDSTRVLGEALAACPSPPRVWLNSSTATIYPHTVDPPGNTEADPIGNKPDPPDTWAFSFDVANRWEEAAIAFKPQLDRTRLVLLRTAIVMNPDRGSAFAVFRNLVKARLGGRQGDGSQYVSWIHDADLCAAVDRLIADDSFAGPVNLAAPNPLPNAAFMAALREACGVRIGLPATAAMIELGTLFMRSESELVLKSRRVIPAKLTNAGFTFQFPEWPAAARELVQRFDAATPRS
ncbi:TIGR01777 family oxidoreductase [Alienimonas chondri]|uniref:Epimerase family protein n=1 Tax=Alienimonas chondri TaxID=2681879 RepID=A0ABX1VDX5_9PLAN|nr:TIGR01777 family oxidoreductase [Alienimonas chondri]NNJ25246.1 Epimerase family protein [Alienimonas chondri]